MDFAINRLSYCTTETPVEDAPPPPTSHVYIICNNCLLFVIICSNICNLLRSVYSVHTYCISVNIVTLLIFSQGKRLRYCDIEETLYSNLSISSVVHSRSEGTNQEGRSILNSWRWSLTVCDWWILNYPMSFLYSLRPPPSIKQLLSSCG